MHFLQKFQWQIPPHKMADSHYPILKFPAPQSALQRQFYPKPKLELKGFGYFRKSRGTVFGEEAPGHLVRSQNSALSSFCIHYYGEKEKEGTAPSHRAAGEVNVKRVNVFKPF